MVFIMSFVGWEYTGRYSGGIGTYKFKKGCGI